jgi:glycosyltransferase involved in cell wall biosynthesis
MPGRYDVPRYGERSVSSASARRSTVASFPPPFTSTNPYQQLLSASLGELGFVVTSPDRLRSRWLWRARNEVGCLHFHWLTPYYHHPRLVPRIARLLLLAQRLVLARALGYRIVWTVHEIYPHTRLSRADVVAPRIVARLASALIVHDEATRQKVASTLGRAAVVVPHGTFADAYPSGRARADVRRGLGIPETAVLMLAFGLIRRYKRLDDLAAALTSVPSDACRDLVVLVAGEVMDGDVLDRLETAARRDERLRVHPHLVPHDEVAELFDACDAAVLTRTDDGTSGALVLALSLGVPVIVADTPGYRSAVEDASVRHWLFAPGDTRSLAEALRLAYAELRDHRRDPSPASRPGVGWSEVAARTGPILSGE